MADGFRLNSPPVVLETVDEETIIVNLESGCYYDLNHTGGRLLEALAAGADAEAATALVAAAYGVEPDDLSEDAGALLERLLAEGILAAANGDGPPAASASEAGPATRPFEAPRLGKYTDMQELLLLDPIHEVDETGWPNRA
jgi:hypothetical protein